MKTALVGLLAALVLAACDSAKDRTANCIVWSGNAYAVAQLRDTGKTELQATETWMEMVKHMPPAVAKKMREEITWVYANPAIAQHQVELDRHKVCLSENWPAFKAP